MVFLLPVGGTGFCATVTWPDLLYCCPNSNPEGLNVYNSSILMNMLILSTTELFMIEFSFEWCALALV